MALIKCPECSKNISDKSITCIHCGYPLNLIINSESVSSKEEKEEKTLSSKNKKSVLLFLAAILALVVVAVSISSNSEKEVYQEMIVASRNNIDPYLEYVGKHYEAGSKISLPSDLYNNIENVEFMGMRGEIDYGTSATTKNQDYYVRYCSWTSLEGFSEEEFQEIAKDLENFFGNSPDIDGRNYKDGHTYRYFWTDPETKLCVSYGHGLFMYHSDGSIEIMWALEFCEGADFFGW